MMPYQGQLVFLLWAGR